MDFTGKQIYDAALRCGSEVTGVLRDLLFDTQSWSVRYLVAEIGTWPSPRRVLFEPPQVSAFCPETHSLRVSLNMQGFQGCPLEQSHPSVSQQFAVKIAGPPPASLHWADVLPVAIDTEHCPNLESARALRGYTVCGGDTSRQHVVGLRMHTHDDCFRPVVAAIIVCGRWNWRRTREIPTCGVTEVNAEMRNISIAVDV